MQVNPLVSIIIPVYNGSEYMKEAIDSALAQTYSNVEVIVVNDGSTDEGKSEAIALEYGDRIKYICKENGGVSTALNAGIKAMSGDYFSWLSHDDVYTPDKVERQIEVLDKYNMKDAIVKSFTCFIDKDSQVLNYKMKKPYEKLLSWDDAIQYVTRTGLNGCSLLIPKEILIKAGGFDERLRYCQDTFMWWKILLSRTTLIMCEHVGVYSRIHEKQLTRTGSALFRHDSELISEYIIAEFVNKSNKNNNLLYEYAKKQAIYGHFKIVKDCVEAAKLDKLLDGENKVRLTIYGVYGCIRPICRTVYYKVVHGIKIK